MPGSNSLVVAALSAVATATILQVISEGTQAPTSIPTREVKQQLGPWSSSPYGIFRFGSPKLPLGPVITARLADKFCGVNEVHLARLPHGETGTASWSVLLSTIHPSPLSKETLLKLQTNQETAKTRWAGRTPLAPCSTNDSQLCIKISRATLITLFAITNARLLFSYPSAAGYRSAYPSYCGQWSISWPIGKACIVHLAPHDSHSAESDVYPPSFPARIDKSVEMLAGIISDGERKLAFPGRAKGKGPWILKEKPKGFGAAHGSRHLYNMQGGKVYAVDLLAMIIKPDLANENENEDEDEDEDEELQKSTLLKLDIPCLASDSNTVAILFVPNHEARLLATAIDSLPWSSLSWSLHRGLRDILLAYGTPIMNRHRSDFAKLLKSEVVRNEAALVKRGWALDFVHGPMADMAESAILSGGGNSGDVVRIVVAIIEVLIERLGFDEVVDRDKTDFWRRAKRRRKIEVEIEVDKGEFNRPGFDNDRGELSRGQVDMIAALTKFFVLEWSLDLDYQLYHNLPVDLFLA